MTFEYFEIVASTEQNEDAGWYFQTLIDGLQAGEACGPFETSEEAILKSRPAL